MVYVFGRDYCLRQYDPTLMIFPSLFLYEYALTRISHLSQSLDAVVVTGFLADTIGVTFLASGLAAGFTTVTVLVAFVSVAFLVSAVFLVSVVFLAGTGVAFLAGAVVFVVGFFVATCVVTFLAIGVTGLLAAYTHAVIGSDKLMMSAETIHLFIEKKGKNIEKN